MGGFSFILIITLSSFVFHSLLPFPFTVDFFLIAAVYISLASNRERTLFIVWGLGIFRGVFSCSPFPPVSPAGYEQEAAFFLYTFPPVAFIGIYLLLNLVRSALMHTHPLTQFLTVAALSAAYSFLDILFNLSVPLMDRLFIFWPHILLIAGMNGLAAVLVFRILMQIPVKAVAETQKGDF
jgi:hypothetical protein